MIKSPSGYTGILQDLACGAISLHGPQQKVLHAEEIVPQFHARLVGSVKGRPQAATDLWLCTRTLHAGFLVEGGDDAGLEDREVHACLFQKGNHDSAFLLQQFQQHMRTLELGMS